MNTILRIISIGIIISTFSLLASCEKECAECSETCQEACKYELIDNHPLTFDGVVRSYDVFLPSSHAYTENMPLIIDMHGFTSSTDNQRKHSDFEDIAEENGIIIVWPQGIDGETCFGIDNRWNANFDDKVDDIGFINALIDQLIMDYHVDEKRIYATGLSNGGFMAYSLACSLSDRIAAVASVAGLMTDNLVSICQPGRAVPILQIHGTKDIIVPWEGDENCGGGVASVEEVVDFWRSVGNCSAEYTEIQYDDTDTYDGCTARMLSYTGCDTNDMVNLLIVDGGGHSWPGSQNMIRINNYYTLPINNDIDASQVIWDFFKQHSL